MTIVLGATEVLVLVAVVGVAVVAEVRVMTVVWSMIQRHEGVTGTAVRYSVWLGALPSGRVNGGEKQVK